MKINDHFAIESMESYVSFDEGVGAPPFIGSTKKISWDNVILTKITNSIYGVRFTIFNTFYVYGIVNKDYAVGDLYDILVSYEEDKIALSIVPSTKYCDWELVMHTANGVLNNPLGKVESTTCRILDGNVSVGYTSDTRLTNIIINDNSQIIEFVKISENIYAVSLNLYNTVKFYGLIDSNSGSGVLVNNKITGYQIITVYDKECNIGIINPAPKNYAPRSAMNLAIKYGYGMSTIEFAENIKCISYYLSYAELVIHLNDATIKPIVQLHPGLVVTITKCMDQQNMPEATERIIPTIYGVNINVCNAFAIYGICTCKNNFLTGKLSQDNSTNQYVFSSYLIDGKHRGFKITLV